MIPHDLHGKSILAIDDTPSIRTFLRISLQSQGVHFHEASTAGDGLSKALALEPDVVVLDLGLPDRDGFDILPALLAMEHPPTVIILSVRKERAERDHAFELGASGYVTKPFIMEDLLDVIHEHIH